jgi:hypothetical protein
VAAATRVVTIPGLSFAHIVSLSIAALGRTDG